MGDFLYNIIYLYARMSDLLLCSYGTSTNLKRSSWDLPWYICIAADACTKRASRAPRTHFRECKISQFPGGAPPCRPPSHTPYCGTPLFVFALGPPNPLGGPGWRTKLLVQKHRTVYLILLIGLGSDFGNHQDPRRNRTLQ